MPRNDDRMHSILIVSGQEQFIAAARHALPERRFTAIDCMRDGASTRRALLEREYDVLMINAPLPDELGAELACDAAEYVNTGILLAVPPEILGGVEERALDRAILTLPKPVGREELKRSLRFLFAIQDKLQALKLKALDAHEKLEEVRIVSKAKCLLIEQQRMTEDEAHRYIGKQAMNRGVSRRRIAEWILEDLE